jgi:hypothetical protein
MSSTVTTTTVVTANTVQIAGAFGLLVILGLIGFVIAKEIIVGTPSPNSAKWNRALLVGIVPLTISFAMIVLVNLTDAMS